MKERWWSAPTEAENGSTIIVTGRDYMDEIIAKGKFNYRVTVSWDYQALPSGMPDDADAGLMEKATDAMLAEFKKDKVAYMTGIYTGHVCDFVFFEFSQHRIGSFLHESGIGIIRHSRRESLIIP